MPGGKSVGNKVNITVGGASLDNIGEILSEFEERIANIINSLSSISGRTSGRGGGGGGRRASSAASSGLTGTDPSSAEGAEIASMEQMEADIRDMQKNRALAYPEQSRIHRRLAARRELPKTDIGKDWANYYSSLEEGEGWIAEYNQKEAQRNKQIALQRRAQEAEDKRAAKEYLATGKRTDFVHLSLDADDISISRSLRKEQLEYEATKRIEDRRGELILDEFAAKESYESSQKKTKRQEFIVEAKQKAREYQQGWAADKEATAYWNARGREEIKEEEEQAKKGVSEERLQSQAWRKTTSYARQYSRIIEQGHDPLTDAGLRASIAADLGTGATPERIDELIGLIPGSKAMEALGGVPEGPQGLPNTPLMNLLQRLGLVGSSGGGGNGILTKLPQLYRGIGYTGMGVEAFGAARIVAGAYGSGAPIRFEETLLEPLGSVLGGIGGYELGAALGAQIGGRAGSTFGAAGMMMGSIVGASVGSIYSATVGGARQKLESQLALQATTGLPPEMAEQLGQTKDPTATPGSLVWGQILRGLFLSNTHAGRIGVPGANEALGGLSSLLHGGVDEKTVVEIGKNLLTRWGVKGTAGVNSAIGAIGSDPFYAPTIERMFTGGAGSYLSSDEIEGMTLKYGKERVYSLLKGSGRYGNFAQGAIEFGAQQQWLGHEVDVRTSATALSEQVLGRAQASGVSAFSQEIKTAYAQLIQSLNAEANAHQAIADSVAGSNDPNKIALNLKETAAAGAARLRAYAAYQTQRATELEEQLGAFSTASTISGIGSKLELRGLTPGTVGTQLKQHVADLEGERQELLRQSQLPNLPGGELQRQSLKRAAEAKRLEIVDSRRLGVHERSGIPANLAAGFTGRQTAMTQLLAGTGMSTSDLMSRVDSDLGAIGRTVTKQKALLADMQASGDFDAEALDNQRNVIAGWERQLRSTRRFKTLLSGRDLPTSEGFVSRQTAWTGFYESRGIGTSALSSRYGADIGAYDRLISKERAFLDTMQRSGDVDPATIAAQRNTINSYEIAREQTRRNAILLPAERGAISAGWTSSYTSSLASYGQSLHLGPQADMQFTRSAVSGIQGQISSLTTLKNKHAAMGEDFKAQEIQSQINQLNVQAAQTAFSGATNFQLGPGDSIERGMLETATGMMKSSLATGGQVPRGMRMRLIGSYLNEMNQLNQRVEEQPESLRPSVAAALAPRVNALQSSIFQERQALQYGDPAQLLKWTFNAPSGNYYLPSIRDVQSYDAGVSVALGGNGNSLAGVFAGMLELPQAFAAAMGGAGGTPVLELREMVAALKAIAEGVTGKSQGGTSPLSNSIRGEVYTQVVEGGKILGR
jgi:hypothetical protein